MVIEKLNKFTSQKSFYEAAIDELLRQASADLLTLVSGIVKEVTKIDAEKIIRRKKGFFRRIKENTKLTAKDINTLVPLQHTLQEVHDNLKELSEKFHIILIVDELDRCLPEYVIKVLERLHHICNEIPVIQILAINQKSLADSISEVYGKDFSYNNEADAWTNIFFESYLQKFVDIIIPLPNGKIDTKVEVLNGLEKNYTPYIRPSNDGQELIKLDDDFLAIFISSLMNGIPKRLQEKIFKQVVLCHKLSLQSGVQYNEEQMTYAILIYEILSCISRFVYHAKDNCKFIINNDYYTLDFYNGISLSVIPETFEYATLFLKWFRPVVEALKALGGSGTPEDVRQQIIKDMKLPESVTTETYGKSNTNKFANQIAFARNYLVYAGYIDKSQQGIWSLTDSGSIVDMNEYLASDIFISYAPKHVNKEIFSYDERIEQFISFYRDSFSKHWKDEKYKWEAIKVFQDNWDINAKDFKTMFEKATSAVSN